MTHGRHTVCTIIRIYVQTRFVYQSREYIKSHPIYPRVVYYCVNLVLSETTLDVSL